MKKTLTGFIALSFTIFFMAVSAPVHAASISISTAPDATSGGQLVSANALFVTGTDSITITLTNLLVNPTSIAQNISGITFSISGGPTTTTPTTTVSPPSLDYINIQTNGTATSATGQAIWTYGGTSSLYALMWNGSGSTVPAYTIIGAPDAISGLYSNANGSLVVGSNQPKDPFIDQVATFTLSIAGITSATIITPEAFLFGTSGSPVSVPEPGTMLLLGVGLIGVATLGRRRIRK